MFKHALMAGMATLILASAAEADTLSLKILGQPAGSGLIAQNKEKPFFESLAKNTGLDVSTQYLPVDVAGIPDSDGLRVLKSGLFDIVSIRGPQVSRDEPSILGLDLIGLNTSFSTARANMDAFKATVDQRLQANFNAKLLGVWPAGPPEVVGISEGDGAVADAVGLSFGGKGPSSIGLSQAASKAPLPSATAR